MKYLIIIAIIWFSSCEERKQQAPLKFREGELVYVGGEQYIVWDLPCCDSHKYGLQKVDCRSEDCLYRVLETEISKTKN